MASTVQHDSSTDAGEERHQARAFDIRIVVASLLGLYGVVLVVVGLVGTSQAELDRADGMNVNLWTGIALVVAAGVFVAWARLRPVVVPDEVPSDDED